jgi:hypothetical protein
MVPGKMKWHFAIKLSSLTCKDITYFLHLMEQNKKQAKFMTSSVWFSEKAQESGYKVAELNAKAKNHTQ